MVIVVANRGTAKAENFNTTLKYTLPSGVTQQYNEVETLEPGESAVLTYRWGIFGPGATFLYGKTVKLETWTDYPPRITELNETNNNCANWVNFVP
jgi:subtilase family serine protease